MGWLAACGETTQDLLDNAFKGLKACPDVDFLTYITGLENAHKDGTAIMIADLWMEHTSNCCRKHMVTSSDKWKEKKHPTTELLAKGT